MVTALPRLSSLRRLYKAERATTSTERSRARGCTMKRTPLVSSMMRSAGYDAISHVLEIEFSTGAVYQYVDVSPDVYRDLLDASSPGRFFHGRIRGAFIGYRIRISAQ